MCRGLMIFLVLVIGAPVAAAAADDWPGAPPDCWSGPRMVHSVQDLGDLWKKNTRITTRQGNKPLSGETSPNRGYLFVVEDGRPTGQVTVFAEKDHLVDIQFVDLFGLSDVRWLNEKLILMRAWWGRIAATDLIFDVERETIIYAESVTDGALAYRQYLESCPLHGCKCIKKK